jgi:anti-anti-sigma regulatory factor
MRFELPRELVVVRAAELKAGLLAAIAAGEGVELDGSAVIEADVAGLQVLCAARRSAAARGRALAFSPGGRSAALSQAIRTAGFGKSADAWLAEEV